MSYTILHDSDPMPYGKYRNVKMSDVPINYLIFLYQNGKASDNVKRYIEEHELLNKNKKSNFFLYDMTNGCIYQFRETDKAKIYAQFKLFNMDESYWCEAIVVYENDYQVKYKITKSSELWKKIFNK